MIFKISHKAKGLTKFTFLKKYYNPAKHRPRSKLRGVTETKKAKILENLVQLIYPPSRQIFWMEIPLSKKSLELLTKQDLQSE